VTQLFDHPYANFLEQVETPTRYTGAEHGSRRKDWASVDGKICLAFPDLYDIGMSHLGYRMLYKILNDNPRLLAERCYTPWVDMIALLRQHDEPLRSLESYKPLSEFDVVGFSLQFELTFTNVLLMLDLGGVPLRSEDRGENDPLVIAGGPVATHADTMALFLDVIAIGDGEELAAEIALMWVDLKAQGFTRKQRLEALASLEGAYVPSLYAVSEDEETGLQVVSHTLSPRAPLPVRRRLLPDINTFPFPDDGPVGGPEAVFDRMSIEVARGCTEGCRFCQAGMIYRPVRERDPNEVIATVERALAKSGQDQVSLTALSTADVSCISPLIKQLVEKTAPERVSLSVASLRAYGLAEDLLDDMRRVRAAGLTFAPEAGTQRMRDVINKNVTEEQLMETAERTFSRGFDNMKLYFMIGLPTETDDDVRGIIQVGKNAASVGYKHRKGRAKVTVSVSTHVPKPHTPFQWCAMDTLDEIRRKQGLLKNTASGARNVNVRVHASITSVLEAILARGDRKLGYVIERAYKSGAIFDSWDEHLRLDHWDEALEHFQIDRKKYLGTMPVSARLPWDHFDIGLEDGFLLREYRKALQSRLSPPCGKAKGMFIHHTNSQEARADERKLVCYDCGIACDMSQMRQERISFLDAMGANEQPRRLPLVQQNTAPQNTAPQGESEWDFSDGSGSARDSSAWEATTMESARRGASTQPFGQDPERLRPTREGIPERWRFRFEKTGPTALLGHLDLLRELPRVIRRAGLRIHYSTGFNPRPDLSFGPALSLGVSSLDEYVDVKLLSPPSDPNLVLERLRRAGAAGLHFLEARPLGPQEPRVNVGITGATYVLALSRKVLTELGNETGSGFSRLEAALASFLSAPHEKVMRRIKGVGKLVDARAFVESMEVTEDAQQILHRAGLVGDLVGIVVKVKISQEGAVKTSEVMEALARHFSPPLPEPLSHRAVRWALHSGDDSPMRVSAKSRTSHSSKSVETLDPALLS
jgi:radical SAM family uncharacterized protein/radical SAM-linked protein